MKVRRIGFDLDGVLVAKPPFVPRWLLHWLFKGSCKKLDYHCPLPGSWNRRLRAWSHHPRLRPPIKANVSYVKKLAIKEGIKLYLISSRYSFLTEATQRLLKHMRIENIFEEIVLNRKNQPPHLFKKEAIERLKISQYFEDDQEVIDYLSKHLPKLQIWLINRDRTCKDCQFGLCKSA